MYDEWNLIENPLTIEDSSNMHESKLWCDFAGLLTKNQRYQQIIQEKSYPQAQS